MTGSGVEASNRLVLVAQLQELSPLRHTPAGVPVIEMLLNHESDVREAGQMRKVEMQISAVALGEMALMLVDTPLGSHLGVEGFLAPTRKGSTRLVLHVQHAAQQGPPSKA